MTSLTHTSVRATVTAQNSRQCLAPSALRRGIENIPITNELFSCWSGTSPLAAAVLTSRPHSAYTKIVDVWFEAAADGEGLVHSIIERSRLRGDAAVKWEFAHANEAPAFARDLGFDVLPTPYLSGAGTEGCAAWRCG